MAFSALGKLLQAPPNLYKVLLAFSQPQVAYLCSGRHSYVLLLSLLTDKRKV
uniref:Uncharacterized protein n=1 Tax=Cucumis melo TaxID=3656 RepID=A0A9I9DDJ9_CUCME